MTTTTAARPVEQLDVYQAIDGLMQSDRGRHTVKHLRDWMTTGGMGLDAANQQHVVTILLGIWGPFPGTVRDELMAAVDG